MVVNLNPEFDSGIYALSVGLSFLGCYMTVVFCEQFRLCSLGAYKSNFLNKKGLFLLMAFSFGGVGMWTMQFIALSSLKIRLESGVYEFVHFSIYPTIFALFASLLLSFGGLYISSFDKMFGKTKQEIVEQFVSDTKKLTFKQIKAISHFRMLFIIATEELWFFVGGGILAGSGTTISACLAQWSMGMSHMTFHWNIGIICGGVLFSWFASTLVFWILFRLLSVYPHMEWLRVSCAFIMAGAISCVHFICFEALEFHSDPGHQQDDSKAFDGTLHIHEKVFFESCIVVAVMFCFILVIIAFSDLRTWIYNMSTTLRHHQDLLEILKKDTAQSDKIDKFIQKHPAMGISHKFSLNSDNKVSSSKLSDFMNNQSEKTQQALNKPQQHQHLLSNNNNTHNNNNHNTDRRIESTSSNISDKSWNLFGAFRRTMNGSSTKNNSRVVHSEYDNGLEVQSASVTDVTSSNGVADSPVDSSLLLTHSQTSGTRNSVTLIQPFVIPASIEEGTDLDEKV